MSLRNEPPFTLPSEALADWLERQGADRWWSVDGDPLLTGRLSFPCPADELACELRRIHRTLRVHDLRDPPVGHGELNAPAVLDALVTRLGGNGDADGRTEAGENDRLLVLSWDDRGDVWLLVEDEETTARCREDAAALDAGK